MKPRKHGLLFHFLDVVFNIIVIVAIVAGIRTFLVMLKRSEEHTS